MDDRRWMNNYVGYARIWNLKKERQTPQKKRLGTREIKKTMAENLNINIETKKAH